ncbi:hypothetical protein [Mesorhizobium sp. M0276]|uniref:hypothetical protein n=1 Tax=Mesorhizobium sp. M0276 TaxID=2956928 RepID=UPI0033380F12
MTMAINSIVCSISGEQADTRVAGKLRPALSTAWPAVVIPVYARKLRKFPDGD